LMISSFNLPNPIRTTTLSEAKRIRSQTSKNY